MELSVIVPVYNAEKYIEECIVSIQKQAVSNMEIIIVNDGSTDSSGQICEKLAVNDERIKIIHRNNGGLMLAWKTGVRMASGDYIGFVDADDWIDENMFSTLLTVIKEDSSDMVVCGLIKDFEDGRTGNMCNSIPTGLYNKKKIHKDIYPIFFSGNGYSRGMTVNRVTKLFKRNILNTILDDLSEEVSVGEDLLTTFHYLLKTNSVSVMKEFTPYHYRINEQSMIKTYKDIKYKKIELLRDELLRITSQDYDFSTQINTDYIKLFLTQLDDEILLSGKNYFQLRSSLKQRVKNNSFHEVVKKAEIKKLSLKYRLYVLFLKRHFWDAALIMRMLKK